MTAEYNEKLAPLFEALAAARAEFPVVKLNRTAKITPGADAKNKRTFEFKYADLASIVSAVTPVLTKHGLTVTHQTDGAALLTTLAHQSGGYIQGSAPMPPWGADPKKWGAAFTYIRRYSLLGIIGLVADEDHDAEVLEPDQVAPAPPPAEPHADTKAAIDKAFETLKLGPEMEAEICLKHKGDADALLHELRGLYVQMKKAEKQAEEGQVL